MKAIVVGSLLLLLSGAAAGRPLPADLRSLAAAERAFAADGLRDGVQRSFVAHFADDAVILHPFVVAGREYYRKHPDRPGTRLLWAPQYLAVSAAGDLGISSGPWRFESERDGAMTMAHGHFFSVWRRNADGVWKVVFDHGIGHAAGDRSVETVQPVALMAAGAHAAAPANAARRRAGLIAADDALRTRLAYDAGNGYASAVRPDTLWLREGTEPRQSPSPPPPGAGAKAACGCGPREVVGMSTSGDLGYTIGGSRSQRDKGVYVRVWRFDAGTGWTLLADLGAAVD